MGSHVLCWTCNCHPWCCLSHELLVNKALCYRWAAYVFSSGQYFTIFLWVILYLFLVLDWWIPLNLPSAWVLGRPTGCLLILTDPASESIPSGLKKVLTRAVKFLCETARVFLLSLPLPVGNPDSSSRLLLTVCFLSWLDVICLGLKPWIQLAFLINYHFLSQILYIWFFIFVYIWITSASFFSQWLCST